MAKPKAILEEAPPPRRRARKQPGRIAVAPRAQERRYRQTVRKVDLWSVLKISVCFYLCALIVAVAAGMVLWWVATAAGVVSNVEEFIGELLGSEDFEFLSWRILRGATFIGLVVVCLMVVVTVLAAALYNLFSELVGGVELTVTEEESAGR